jgi:molybdate-binding protein/DNA-binding XRE family transcriptional regulator
MKKSTKQETDVSSNLKATRSRLGISQQQLADVAGVSRQAISGIEAGLNAPSAAVALRLAKALGCTVEELFWLDEDLPIVEAVKGGDRDAAAGGRVLLAKVGDRWIAHSLQGEGAFRTEMVPADGVVEGAFGYNRLKVKLLDDPESLSRTVVVAGCTPALSLWARSAERWYPGLRVHWTHANSMAALESLARREVHAAGMHLYDPYTDEYNASFVREAIPHYAVTLINLGVWEEGFVVADENPHDIYGVEDLRRERIKLVNREKGAGARMLLDNLMKKVHVRPEEVLGYEKEVTSHEQVGRAVAEWSADVGVSTASVAQTFGLGFVPIRKVRYDLAVIKDDLGFEPLKQLLSTLHHHSVRSQLSVLGGYDTSLTGEIVEELA